MSLRSDMDKALARFRTTAIELDTCIRHIEEILGHHLDGAEMPIPRKVNPDFRNLETAIGQVQTKPKAPVSQ